MDRENFLQVETSPPSGQPSQLPETVPSERPYERKFSFFQRLLKILFSPSEGMKDVALTPSFSEVFVIIILEIIVAVLALSLVLMKIQFVGTAAWFLELFLGNFSLCHGRRGCCGFRLYDC